MNIPCATLAVPDGKGTFQHPWCSKAYVGRKLQRQMELGREADFGRACVWGAGMGECPVCRASLHVHRFAVAKQHC